MAQQKKVNFQIEYIPVSHASCLLKILHHEAGLKFLPLDARTLLGSLRTKVQTTDMRPGRYYNFGFAISIPLPSQFSLPFCQAIFPKYLN
jgi:hypothetical protein